MSKRRVIGYIVIGLIIVAFVAALIKFGPFREKVTPLEGVEVTEYQGKNLSSVNDFRENSIMGPQYIDIANYSLDVNGLVAKPVSYTYDQVISGHDLYKKVVRLNCVEGWAVNILWEGVKVSDLLKEANPLPTANTIIFHAYDKYTTSFPIGYIMDNPIILAYKVNDVTIPPERGYPFMLVAEDKWGYKWIKWVTRIELSDDIGYEGFWESRGYNNDGTLGNSYLRN